MTRDELCDLVLSGLMVLVVWPIAQAVRLFRSLDSGLEMGTGPLD